MLNLIIACVLAAILGFAVHRASICTVRAVAELTHSGTGYMFGSIVKSALWVFAITIPVFLLLPQTAAGVTGWQLTVTAMLGGLLFGIGAGVNGACAYATMARMVDGEIAMLLTVAGFVLGVLLFVVLLGSGTLVRPAPAPSQIPGMLPIAPYVGALLVALGLYEFIRLWRSRPPGTGLRDLVLAPAYRLSSAALLMGLAAGAIFLLFGSPGYTTTFQQVIEAHAGTRPMPPYGRWIVLGAVLFGMLASTLQRGSFRIDWKPRLSWLRNIFGGILMGLGCALLPGGNDALILYGIPGLSPHALPAYGALLLGIFVALITMRAIFRVEMRVACRNDMYIADASADLGEARATVSQGDAMKLQFAGCGDAFGSGGRFNTCVHVEDGARRFLLDCGATSLIAMKRAGIDRGAIDAVLLTHFHADHFGGIPFFILDQHFIAKRTRPLLIAGPPGLNDWYARAMALAFPGERALPFDLELQEVEIGTAQTLAGMTVTPFHVRHDDRAGPCLAYRIESGGRTLCFSGDTEWTDTLIEAACGADLFICECYMYETLRKSHMTLSVLRQHLPAIGAKRVILTHLSEDMLAHFPDVELECAVDGMVVEV